MFLGTSLSDITVNITNGLTAALPQHPERCSAHYGPSLTSQLVLGTDLRPKKPPRGPNEPQFVFLGDVPEYYGRDLSFLGPVQPSHNSREVVPPILDQV